MKLTNRALLALGLAASLAGCGWGEKGKAAAARRAEEDAAVAAAKAGDVAKVRDLLARDPSLAQAPERFYPRKGPSRKVGTMLTAAAASGKPELVALLLDAGLDADAAPADSRTRPLHVAAALDASDGRDVAIAELLLARGARLDPLDDGGRTPVHVLLNRGGEEAPRLSLLRLFLSRPGATELRDEDGRAPLHFAAYFRRHAFVEALLLAGADPNAKVTTKERLPGAEPIDGETPLHAAVRGSEGSGRADGVLLLCAAGADPAATNDAGFTPEALVRRLAAARKNAPPGLVRAAASLADAVAPGGPCATWLARFRAEGRPASFAAARLAERAYNCEAGDYLACQELAEAHEAGDGVPKDLGKALAFFVRACEANGYWACSMVGSYHLAGKGVAENATEAARWFSRACDGGRGWSCNQLGKMTRDGEGIPRDPARALALFEAACRNGSDEGCANGRALKAAGP